MTMSGGDEDDAELLARRRPAINQLDSTAAGLICGVRDHTLRHVACRPSTASIACRHSQQSTHAAGRTRTDRVSQASVKQELIVNAEVFCREVI